MDRATPDEECVAIDAIGARHFCFRPEPEHDFDQM
jgi:hypothetical protein